MDVTNEMIDAAQSELNNLIGDSELERSYIKAAIEAVIQVMFTNKDKEDFKV